MSTHIKQFLRILSPRDSSWQTQLVSQWPTIMGSLSQQVTLEKIEGDVLVLGVFDSCWMQELFMLSPLIISTINKNLDQQVVRAVRFKKTVLKKQVLHRNTVAVKRKNERLNLTTAQQKALESIKDPELRVALVDFFIRCSQEK